jgi:hypothetical protein
VAERLWYLAPPVGQVRQGLQLWPLFFETNKLPRAPLRIRLAEFALAISLASDLGPGHPRQMVLATCLLSLRLGERK